MASLSAVRSPSQQTNATFLVSSGALLGSHFQHPHHHHYHHQLQHQQQLPLHQYQGSTSSSVTTGVDSVSYSEGLVGSGKCVFQESQSKLYYEADFSSPTSWEFRNSNSCPFVSIPSTLPLPPRQMPTTAVLPSASSSSSASTPSPLDEAPYQMHMSLLRSSSVNDGHAGHPSHIMLHRIHSGHLSRHTSPHSTSCHSPVMPPASMNSSVVVQNVSNGCACVNANGTMVILNGGERDLSGNGSDGSRNSTGSHRSQDSGFSDSGESRRNAGRKVANDTFNHSVQHQNMSNGNGHVHQSPVNFDNGVTYQHLHHLPPTDYECSDRLSDPNGKTMMSVNGNYCQATVPLGHSQNGYSSPHVYDCIPMPSPIPSSGFGCGRLVASEQGQMSAKQESRRSTPTGPFMNGSHPNAHLVAQRLNPPQTDGFSTYTVTPHRRPASVDISQLERNGHCTNGMVTRMVLSPSPPPTNCTSCLTSSSHQEHNSRAHQRRSFSPQRASSPHPNDIALLASSCTATAVAALRVPLSCSTPKRFSNSASTSKITNGMIKIDNFESLNKNINKDNNNNSSNSSTPGKSGNKSFTLGPHIPQQSNKDSRSVSQINCFPNGTVLAEDSSLYRPLESTNSRESALHLGKQSSGVGIHSTSLSSSSTAASSSRSTLPTRTAAESIYDKICSRLSSLSSSTSSSASPSTSLQGSLQQNSCSTNGSTNGFSQSTSTAENQTVVMQRRTPNGDTTKINGACGDRLIQAEGRLSRESYNSSELNTSQIKTHQPNGILIGGGETSQKFKLFAKSSTSKWQSLPRGISPKRLSLLEESKDTSYLDYDGMDHPVDVPVPLSSTAATSTSTLTESNGVQTSSNSSGKWKHATGSVGTPVEQQADSKVLKMWLQDLRTQTEPECMHSLQTKWIVPGDVCLDEDEDDDNDRTTICSTSESPATTVTSSTLAGATGPGAMSSHLQSENGPSSEHYLRNQRKASTLSYVHRQVQRRSQQKFLSSMTEAIHAVSTPLMSIRNVEMTANVISGEFSKICKHLEFGIFTQVPTLVVSLVGHIEDFLRAFHNSVGFGNLRKLEIRLENACYALQMAAKSMSEAALMISSSTDSGHNSNDSCSGGGSCDTSKSIHHPRPSSASSSTLSSTGSPDCPMSTSSSGGVGGESYLPSSCPSSDEQGPDSLGRDYHVVVSEVVEGIVTVGNLFSQVVDLRLTRDLACILDTVEGGGIPARIALKSLVTVLADGGNHICRLAADIRTVRGLLGVLLDTREDQDKILALRCLATVLCVGEAVKDFDKAGGFEIIGDLLYEPTYSMWMKIEAVAVLTQATDPWIDLETTLMTLGVHLEKFIVSLTNLIREFKTDEEPFLLIVAAISNLTFLEVASTEYLKKCRTVSYLIDAVKGNPSFSIFILDHIATILANMAGVESSRQEIIQCGGIDAILHFLQQRPGKTESVSAITACERLQQKSTIALSRLCNEDGVARYVFDKGGVHRLITLCQKEKERNYSDGVLIAALATLRKLVTSCGDHAVKDLGAEDLIEPRLLDSFLLYSSRQESYV